MRLALRLGLPAVLAALLLAFGPPPATGCSIAVPPDFQRLQWLEVHTLLTNQASSIGRYDVTTGSFESLVSWSDYAASPDGAWLAFSHGGERFEPHPNSTCGDTILGATEVVHLASGERAKVLDGSARNMAAGRDHLVLRHVSSERLLVYRWDDLAHPRAFEPRFTDPAFAKGFEIGNTVGLALSPGDALLAVTMGGADAPFRFYLFNLTSGEPLDQGAPTVGFPESSPFRSWHIAFAPRGDAVAVAAGGDRRFGEVHVAHLNATGAGLDAYAPAVEAARGLAWGPGGVAVVYRSDPFWYLDHGQSHSVIRVFPRDLAAPRERDLANATVSGGVAWSPDGTRLAIGTSDGLLLFDAGLEGGTVAPPAQSLGAPRFAPPPASPGEGGTARVPEAGAVLALAALGAAVLAARRRPPGGPQEP